jgi:Negative regulator of beta-lactamase expression
MSTSAQVAAYEHEARQIPGLPANITYLPDNPAVTSGLRAFMENGVGFIEGAPSYTVTKRIALHELGHLWHFNNRGKQDAFWTARFGACTTAPKTWAEAYADAHTGGTEIWMVLPGETIAESFAVAVEGSGKERTLDYGCTINPASMRTFFGYVEPTVTHDIEWLGPVPTTNFSQGRGGNAVSLIVDHWMATTFDGALAHFMSPTAQVSAQYLISQKGRIVQVVRDEDTAYHAGSWSVNQKSIGIEHEGGPNLPPFTSELYAASAWLHHKLSLDYGIRLVVGESVKPHGAIVATQCPGTLDLDRIVREAGGEDDMFTDADRAKLEKIYARMEVEETRQWIQRLQDWLSKVFKSFPSYARPSDYSGPDVTSGQPRT